ncbi:MAG: response regulator, partial [Anaerolineae bacterium]
MNGLEATRLLCQRALAPRVVIVTSYDDLEYRVAAVAVGASGYLVKPDLALTLLPLLHSLFPSRVMAVSVA